MDKDLGSPPDTAAATDSLAPDAARKQRAANIRTALVFLLISITFLFGVIFARHMGGYEAGMSIVGFAVFVFLVFAIGRNLRSRK